MGASASIVPSSARAHAGPARRSGIRRLLHENGLTVAMGGLFLASLVAQIVFGHAVYEHGAVEKGLPSLSLGAYLTSGHAIEALFENWESEFLQMGVFVVLTRYLRQKGSSESKKIDAHEEVDDDPREKQDEPGVPWAVRKGGVVLWLYERSLAIALFSLFAVSLVLHAYGGGKNAVAEGELTGGPLASTVRYMGTSQFWFESFQNWQSEFMSVAALIVLSIFLRQRGSSQSKPVAAPHGKTGEC